MKIALVHDFLLQDGGAERVLRELIALWPEAPVFCLMHDSSKNPLPTTHTQESWLARIPGGKRFNQALLPLIPIATESHNLSGFDVIISSSSMFAKGIIPPIGSHHICYCHTPARFLWTDTHNYIRDLGLPRPIRALLPPLLTHLRSWDTMSTSRVHTFIANSRTVQERISHIYGRKSTVIHPPVAIHMFSPVSHKEDYFLAGGRLVGYKRFDMAIAAFNRLGMPLKIFGEGPDEKRLMSLAKRNIEFVGKVSDTHKAHLYAHARAYIHPQIEDFGITAVEAMASGTPVIAYAGGGALETVIHGVTGLLFHHQDWASLGDSVIRFQDMSFSTDTLVRHAAQFSVETFAKKMQYLVHNPE